MLGIVSMAGNALKAFGNTHPAVKWGVIVLAFLLAAEFVAKEGVSVYRDIVLVQPTIEKTKGEADQAKAQGDAMKFNPDDDPADPQAAHDGRAQGSVPDIAASPPAPFPKVVQ